MKQPTKRALVNIQTSLITAMNARNALDRRIYELKKERDAIIASWEPKKK